jgi:hypothetical protein
MDNIYYISKDDPDLLVNKIGMIEDGYDPWGMNDSLPLELYDSPLNIHGKSMGCIACAVFNAKPAKLGKIDNISRGGLMFHHADSKEHLSQALVLDILLADCGFYLANIPFKTITDVVIPDEVFSDAVEMRQVRLQFQQLNAIQQARLKYFIMNHGTEENFE